MSASLYWVKSSRNQLYSGLVISSSHMSQELTQNIKLILPKLGFLLLNCFPAC